MGDLALPTDLHIGIIMDGNGRWAKQRGLPRSLGHKRGAQTFRKIVRHCNKLGVGYLTVYAFSTENWKRPPQEIDGIINLLKEYLKDAKNYKAENVRTRFIGDLSVFDDEVRALIDESEAESNAFTGLNLNIAINYGGQNELVAAMRTIAERVKSGEIRPDEIDEAMVADSLYTRGQPPVDLIIRPSGEYRLSNFMLWQSAYAEYVFMNILWPDFDERQLEVALKQFLDRDRRFGGI